MSNGNSSKNVVECIAQGQVYNAQVREIYGGALPVEDMQEANVEIRAAKLLADFQEILQNTPNSQKLDLFEQVSQTSSLGNYTLRQVLGDAGNYEFQQYLDSAAGDICPEAYEKMQQVGGYTTQNARDVRIAKTGSNRIKTVKGKWFRGIGRIL